ncbi:hypothetical protein [Natrialba sp. PRR66]|uniref:hypothetical protein n=1 Tax=Natrialba sp. PRR66 TaxID=3098146 RepID=UPI002B1D7C5E|nr:hypothetical protein [Natrialba sp. PRR66]
MANIYVVDWNRIAVIDNSYQWSVLSDSMTVTRYRVGFVVIIVALIVGNVVAVKLLPFEVVRRIVGLEGLVFAGIGSVFFRLSNLPRAEEYLRDTDLDERVEAARRTLFVNQDTLKADDGGFEETVDVILEHSELSERPDFVHPREPGAMGAVGYVSFIYGDEVSRDEEVKSTAPQPVVDGWLNQFVEGQKQQMEVRWLHRGASLFIVGFGLQIIAAVSLFL